MKKVYFKFKIYFENLRGGGEAARQYVLFRACTSLRTFTYIIFLKYFEKTLKIKGSVQFL